MGIVEINIQLCSQHGQFWGRGVGREDSPGLVVSRSYLGWLGAPPGNGELLMNMLEPLHGEQDWGDCGVCYLCSSLL